MADLYALVDNSTFQIITPLSKLPENWSNISGLNFFDDDKLSNLSWAGHPDLGWISYSDRKLFTFASSANWVDSSKANIKSYIATDRKEKTEYKKYIR